MRRVALLASIGPALLAVAGCSTYRPVAPLDDGERAEMSALGARLRAVRVEVVGAQLDSAEEATQVADVLRRAGADVADSDGAMRVSVRSSPVIPSVASGEGKVLLFLLTLGLFPQDSSDTVEWTFEVAPILGRTESFVEPTTRPGFCSWIAGPWALLPGWRFGRAGCHVPREGDDERANRRDRAVLALARRLAALAP
jgi:hypothetical protein